MVVKVGTAGPKNMVSHRLSNDCKDAAEAKKQSKAAATLFAKFFVKQGAPASALRIKAPTRVTLANNGLLGRSNTLTVG